VVSQVIWSSLVASESEGKGRVFVLFNSYNLVIIHLIYTFQCSCGLGRRLPVARQTSTHVVRQQLQTLLLLTSPLVLVERTTSGQSREPALKVKRRRKQIEVVRLV